MVEHHLEYREVPGSPAMTAAVDKFLNRIGKFSPDLQDCELVVSRPQHRRHKGDPYRLLLKLRTRGADILVRTKPGGHGDHADFYVALRDCYRAARRKLEDHAQRQRRDIKAHARLPHARVTELWSDHGFLETAEGRSVYFHAHSVLHGAFRRLKVGDEVRYSEEMGEDGPQASSLSRVGHDGRHELYPEHPQA